MATKPRWREVFDTVERAVGAPLEDVVGSQRFVEVMATRMKTQRAVAGAVGRAVGAVAATLLHAVNMPTRDDVRRLNRNVAALAGEIRALEQAQRSEVARASGRPDRGAAAKRSGKPGGAG